MSAQKGLKTKQPKRTENPKQFEFVALKDLKICTDPEFVKSYYTQYFDSIEARKTDGIISDDELQEATQYLWGVYNRAAELDKWFEIEHLKVRDNQDNFKIVDYKPKAGQRMLYAKIKELEAKGKPIRISILKYRQGGYSTAVQAYFYAQTKRNPGVDALVMAHLKNTSAKVFGMYRTFYMYDPVPRPAFLGKQCLNFFSINDPTCQNRLKHSNKESMVWDLWDESQLDGGNVWISTGWNDDSDRGGSLAHVHATECEFFKDAGSTFKGLMPSIPYKKDTSIFLESTGEQHGSWFYQHFFGAKTDGFERMFFPWSIDENYVIQFECVEEKEDFVSTLDDTEKNYLQTNTLTLEQLNFRRMQMQQPGFDGDPIKFASEFPLTPEEAFMGSGRAYFSASILAPYIEEAKAYSEKAKTLHYKIEPCKGGFDMLLDHNGEYHEFTPPLDKHDYVIGVDTAVGREVKDGNPDNTVIQILDRGNYPGEITPTPITQVAEYTKQAVDPDRIADIATMLGYRFNKAYIAIELNGAGHTALNKVVKSGYPYIMMRPTMELKQQIDMVKWGQASKIIKVISGVTSNYGWHTNSKTRDILLDHIKFMLRERNLILRSVPLMSELTSFLQGKDGKPSAASGCWDDRIFALGIALQAIEYTPRSNDAYAIDPENPDEDLKFLVQRWEYQAEIAAANNGILYDN